MEPQRVPVATELLGDDRLFIVSNRGPLSIIPDDDAPDGLVAERGAGGLVTALGGIAGRVPVTWVAAALGEGDDRAARRRGVLDRIVREALPDQDLELVLQTLPPEVHELHYRVFANPFLWFLQHGLAAEARALVDDRLLDAWERGYVAANERLGAAAVRAIAGTPRPVVWVHDYQLYLVSRHVRRARPDATLAHFTHIPWPGPAAWSVLPRAIVAALVDGLLANDLVAFQTPGDAQRFVETVAAVTGRRIGPGAREVTWQGRRVAISAHPISVEPEAIRRIATSAQVERRVARLRWGLADRGDPLLIVRVDRLDPTKNALRGFLAFEELLARRPALRDRVRFLAVMAPTRSGIAPYDRYAEDVERVVRRIAGRGDTIHVERDGGYDRAIAALRVADVVLVNSVADGMNLVAKEAVLVGERDPALILSRTAGVARELGPYALTVEPLDVGATADALERALAMPREERAARTRAMRLMVESHGIDRWLTDNLSEMLAARRRGTRERTVAAGVARRVEAGVAAIAPRAVPGIARRRRAPFPPA